MIEHFSSECPCVGKKCTQCQEVKCIEAFHRDKKRKDGRYPHCSVCSGARVHAYYLANREKINARKRAYMQVYNRAHSDDQQTYHRARPEQAKRAKQKYYQSHPDRFIVRNARSRARKYQAPGEFTVQEWQDLKARYNYTCLCCGKQEPEIKLTPDHVIPFSKGGSNFIENIQPFCLSCNNKKFDKITDYRNSA